MLELHKNRLTQLLTETAPLKEFDIMSSKLRQENSSGIYYQYIEDAIPKKLHRKLVEYVTKGDSGRNDLRKETEVLPKSLEQQLKSAGKVIAKSGSKCIVLYKSDGNNYILYDFSKPVNRFNFVVGVMWTTTYNSTLNYSPKKTFNLNNLERIHFTHLDKRYIGQGYGKFLYDNCLKYMGAVISDSTLFNESFGMWTGHIRRNAKFFGIMVSTDRAENPHNSNLQYNRIIIPVTPTDTLDKKTLNRYEGANGFIAIFNSVPPLLQKMSGLFGNTPLEDIGVVECNQDFSPEIDELFSAAEDHGDIFRETNLMHISGWSDIDDYTTIAWIFKNVTVVSVQFEDSIDYVII